MAAAKPVSLPMRSRLPSVVFDDISFPVESIRIKGGLRDHVHEYPHADGGQPEKLGRKLYEFTIVALFDEGIKTYDTLYPHALNELALRFGQGTTGVLSIPFFGDTGAYCYDWERETTSKILSGERATFIFREEPDELVASVQDIDLTSPAAEKALALSASAIMAELTKEDIDILTAITDAVNVVRAVGDQADAFASRGIYAVQHLIDRCAQAENSILALNKTSAANQQMLEDLKALWASAQELYFTIVGDEDPIIVYTTWRAMTIQEVAIAVYGDTSRSMEILQLNAIDDPFAIPAGTGIRIYQPDRAARNAA